MASNPEPGTNSMEESVSKLNNAGFSKNRCFSLAAVKTLKQSCATLSGHATATKQGINLATYSKCLLRALKTVTGITVSDYEATLPFK